jgi:hypothetical protein
VKALVRQLFQIAGFQAHGSRPGGDGTTLDDRA